MTLLTVAFFLITGFILGSLGASIHYLQKEVDDARRNGDRR